MGDGTAGPAAMRVSGSEMVEAERALTSAEGLAQGGVGMLLVCSMHSGVRPRRMRLHGGPGRMDVH